MRKLTIVLSALVIGLLIAAVWNEHVRFSSFHAENHQRIAKVEDDVRALRADIDNLTKASKTASSVAPAANADLPQIRGAIAELRRRAEELEKKPSASSATNANARPPEAYVYPDSKHRTDYTFAGFASAPTAAESVLWAITKMDRKSFEKTLTDEQLKFWTDEFKDLPPDVMSGGFRNGSMFRATGFKVTEEIPVAEDETHLKVFLEGENNVLKLRFKKVGADWKWAGNF
jgi:hypothetical protein